MITLVALVPPAVVLVAVLGFRASSLAAASAAAVSAVAMWAGSVFRPASVVQLTNALADASVLTLLVAAMIVPGILFVEASRKRHSPEAIAGLVDCFQTSAPRAAIAIAVGIGVAVESLTGMGVSLLITVPLLARVLDRRRTMPVALAGMAMMPFGALSISAHVGANLSGVPLDVLSVAIAKVALLPALLLPSVVLAFAGAAARDVAAAALSGVLLAAGIALAVATAGIEVAGVLGGLAVAVGSAVTATKRGSLGKAVRAPGLRPYLALLVAAGVQKSIAASLAAAGFAPALSTGRVTFAALTSPGIALLVAAAGTLARHVTPSLLVVVCRRAWRPVLSIAIFMLAARLMVESGAIAALAGGITGLGRGGAVVAVALLAAVGGFATGSGVTGNALFMASAADVGRIAGHADVFAALQNMASGHVAMASLPVLAILLAAMPDRQPGDESTAMRVGLAIAAWNVALATLGATVLLRIAG